MDLQQHLLELLQQHPQWALLISLLVSTIVAVAGLVPSVFVTAANIYFFGFLNGTLVSIAGESIGAAVSFVLYRYFFRHKMQQALQRFPTAAKLVLAEGWQAAVLVFTMRLLPMVPSGIVTFAAAIGQIGIPLFVAASTIGKVPALLLEAAIVIGFLKATWPSQLLMVAIAVTIAWTYLRRKKKTE